MIIKSVENALKKEVLTIENYASDKNMRDYKELARQARIKVLEMVHKAKTSHIASNFSVIDIATVLYENLKEGDLVVWSKGWAAASIYYFLAKQGKIPVEDLDKFAQEENGEIKYLGLAETTTPGVLVNGGSVGHGLSVAVGMALGKKRAGEKGTVYCIMSDGELNEGAVWEAAMIAHHHKLDNLVAVIDANHVQAMGFTKDIIDLEPIQNRFTGFGWEYFRGSGHDFEFLHKVFSESILDSPTAIIFDTVKGRGVSFMEGLLLYHYKHVDQETFNKALKELCETN